MNDRNTRLVLTQYNNFRCEALLVWLIVASRSSTHCFIVVITELRKKCASAPGVRCTQLALQTHRVSRSILKDSFVECHENKNFELALVSKTDIFKEMAVNEH